jgi:hypothetical protein
MRSLTDIETAERPYIEIQRKLSKERSKGQTSVLVSVETLLSMVVSVCLFKYISVC